MCFSETHLSEMDKDRLIQIVGYNVVYCILYIKKSWKYELINSIVIDLDIWRLLVLKVNDGNNVIYLSGDIQSA